MTPKSSHRDFSTPLALGGMALGLVLGILTYQFNLQEYAAYLHPLGDIFLRLLKMIIVPLIFTSIYMAVLNLDGPKDLRTLGKRTLIYYFSTTMVAVFFGLLWVNLIEPGVGMDKIPLPPDAASITEKFSKQEGLYGTILSVVTDIIPTSPIDSMAKSNVLQVIFFSGLLGLAALLHKKETQRFSGLVSDLNEIIHTLTSWIIALAPIGIFVLMFEMVATIGPQAIWGLAKYGATVVIGLFFHGVLLLLVGSYYKKWSPLFLLRKLMPPLTLAFSSASSAATLPVTMSTLLKRLGVKKKNASFVLPLGATVNMDGTALYESVAVLFIAQIYGIPMPIEKQVIIFLTATLAAVGAASIPGAGLITMSIVLKVAGLPLEGIGLILAIDRLLDMFRTAVNVLGDCIGATIVDSMDTGEDADQADSPLKT